MLKINEIMHGDCLEVMKDISDKSIDMILCDLPYGTTSCRWDTIIPLEPLWEQYKRIIKDNAVIILTATQPFTSVLVTSNIKMFKYELIWDKNLCKNPGLAKIRPLPSFESILIFGKGKIVYNPQMEKGEPYKSQTLSKSHGDEHSYGFNNTGKVFKTVNKGTRFPKSVIQIRNPNRKGQHPTQKPVSLFEYLIKTYSNEGDLILDNCAGSFTTAIASENLKRNWICIEKEDEYCKIGKNRIERNRIERNRIKLLTLF